LHPFAISNITRGCCILQCERPASYLSNTIHVTSVAEVCDVTAETAKAHTINRTIGRLNRIELWSSTGSITAEAWLGVALNTLDGLPQTPNIAPAH
jgi:hypothetical protein